jgi:hypothetical protein
VSSPHARCERYLVSLGSDHPLRAPSCFTSAHHRAQRVVAAAAWAAAPATKAAAAAAERSAARCVLSVLKRRSVEQTGRRSQSERSRPRNRPLNYRAWPCSFREDLKTMAEQLVHVRRTRLQRLYDAERVAWQEELVARGLSLAQDQRY